MNISFSRIFSEPLRSSCDLLWFAFVVGPTAEDDLSHPTAKQLDLNLNISQTAKFGHP